MSKGSKKRGRLSLPVLVVAFAIGHIYFTSVLFFIDKWFGLWSSPGLMNAAVCVYNYVVAILTDPGQVPPSFVPDIEDVSSPIQEIKRKVLLLGSIIYDPLKDEHKPEGSSSTTYYYEGVRAMWLAEKGGQVYMHPYDLGAFENLTSVLGRNIVSWVCPTRGHIGSGLLFRTRYDKLSATPTSQ